MKITPTKGQRVQCLIKGGGTVEGIVESWSDQQSILHSLDGRHLFIIAHTEEDIVLTSIALSEPKPEPELKENIRDQLHKVQQSVGDPELEQANVDDLKQMLIRQERKILAEKVKDHFGDAKTKPYATKYETPSFFKKDPK